MSSSSQPHRPAFPQRRRPRGPLHPPNRPAPSPVSSASAAHPAFVAAPTKKRNWTPGVAGPSTATSSIITPLDTQAATSSSSSVGPSWSQQPYRTASSGSWYYDAQAQLAGPSRSGSNNSFHYDAPSSSTTSTSNPVQPPRGEFSFESRRRGTPSATWDVGELPDSDGAGLGPGRVSEAAASNVPPSPARASLQRAQERERAAAAAAANGAGPASASSSGITSDQAANEHVEGPAPKKRRGVAGAIVEGALHTALYAGAAAITAYTLWSSWGRRSPGEEEQPSVTEEEVAARKKALDNQTLPGALSEEPPPPYAEGAAMSPSPSTSSLPSNSRSMLTQRVYVSSHRRRPALPPARHARVEQARRNRHAARQGLNSGSSSTNTTAMNPPLPIEPPQPEDDDEDGEDDEYSRMSRQMAALIKEGQAALSAQVDIEDMDDEEDEVGGTSANLSGLALPKSRSTGSTGGLGLVGTPARLKLGAGAASRGGDSPLRARASTSGTPGAGADVVVSGNSWATYALPEPSKATQQQRAAPPSLAKFRSASQIDFDFASHGAPVGDVGRLGAGSSVPPSPSAPSLGYTATNPFARHGSGSTSSAAPFVFGSGSGVGSSLNGTAGGAGGGSTPSASVFGGSASGSPFGAHGRIGQRPSPYARSSGAAATAATTTAAGAMGGGFSTPPNRKPRWQ